MPARQDVVQQLAETRDQVSALVESAPEGAWRNATYEGWTCRDLLSHIASTSGPASFVLTLARVGAPGGSGAGGFDQDEFNRQQVAMRAERSVADVLNEIRSNIQRDIQAVEAAPEELLEKQFTAPWGVEGTVAEVIIASLTGHLGMHIADLRKGLAASA